MLKSGEYTPDEVKTKTVMNCQNKNKTQYEVSDWTEFHLQTICYVIY